LLEKTGFTNVVVSEEGVLVWAQRGYPLTPRQRRLEGWIAVTSSKDMSLRIAKAREPAVVGAGTVRILMTSDACDPASDAA
jgi:hypothetical protein